MSNVAFVAEDKEFDFPLDIIPKDSLLYALITTDNKVDREIINKKLYIKTEYDKNEFQIIYDYLVNGKIPKNDDDESVMDYFLIDKFHSYDWVISRENKMRKYMYLPEYAQHEMNTDNLYELITIDETEFNKLKVPDVIQKDVLYDFNKLIKNDWSTIKESLISLDEIIKAMGRKCIVAGGKIFNSIFDTKVKNSDIDIFIYGCSQEEAIGKIKLLAKYINNKYLTVEGDHGYGVCLITRTANAITFKIRFGNDTTSSDGEYVSEESKVELQIIFRLYKSISEVLHGFDVDCCAMGYDGTSIYATKRCIYSLMNGYNTINFERMSPSYELRLAKYGSRGMGIYIPGLEKSKINTEEMAKFHKDVIDSYTNQEKKENDRYRFVNNLKGLDILLFLEYRLEHYKFNQRVIDSIRILCEERSDYSSVSYRRTTRGGNYIDDILHFLYRKHKIIKDSDKYLHLIEELRKDVPNIFENFEFLDNLSDENNDTDDEEDDNSPNNDDEDGTDNDDIDDAVGHNGEPLPEFDNFEDYINYLRGQQQENNLIIKHDDDDSLIDKNLNFSLEFKTNTVRKPMHVGTNNTFEYLSHLFYTHNRQRLTFVEIVNLICDYPIKVYNILTVVKPWTFEPSVKFKTINPGEQMTNTFNQSIYSDNNLWFYNKFYKK